MKKSIKIYNKEITYSLKRSKRARKIRLAVYFDGRVVVTAPFSLNQTVAEKFIKDKSFWIFEKVLHFSKLNLKVLNTSGKRGYLKNKDKAYKLAVERVNYFNKIYNFRFNKINIKNQKTRWGSCSKKGNLSFNYKIALLPKKLLDYVIVHELCHLAEFNHSKKFWNLVSRTVPDYISVKKEFKNKVL